MNEKQLSVSESNGQINNLYEHECVAVVILTQQRARKTLDSAAFTFFFVGNAWYRVSFRDRAPFCKLDYPAAPIYRQSEDGFSYLQTDLSPLILREAVRITDAYIIEGQNYTKCRFSFTHSRTLELCNYWDSGNTVLSIL